MSNGSDQQQATPSSNQVGCPCGCAGSASLADPRHLISALFNSSTVGLAIVDRQLRYTAINNTLAAMNGIPASDHVGRTVRDILGDAAVPAEMMLRRVFASGRLVSRWKMSVLLPNSAGVRSGIIDYFPLKDATGEVQHIVVIVVEIPADRNWDQQIRGKLAGAPKGATDTVRYSNSALIAKTQEQRDEPRSACNSVPRTTSQLLIQFGPTPRYSLCSALFKDLESPTAETILNSARVRRAAKGEYFCRQGETANRLFVLRSGLVKITGTTQSGKEILVCWMAPGDVFGLDAVAKPAILNIWSVQACEPSEALEFEKSTIQDLAKWCPAFYQNALWIAVRWTHELQARFEQIATEGVEQRLARAVVELAARFHDNRAQYVELHASDEELAQMIGTTLFTVSKVLNRWKKLGYVQKGRKRLLIVHMDHLLRVARGPSASSGSS